MYDRYGELRTSLSFAAMFGALPTNTRSLLPPHPGSNNENVALMDPDAVGNGKLP